MFVTWKITRLSPRKYDRDAWLDCPHDKAPDAERWAPLVCVAERIGGKPRRRVVYRLGASIRPCCAAETAAPFVRVRFWRAVEKAMEKAPAEVQAHRQAIESAIAARAPQPTYLEEQIGGRLGFSFSHGRTKYETELNMWAAAKKAYGESLRGEDQRSKARDPRAEFEERFRRAFEEQFGRAFDDAWRRAQEGVGSGYRSGFSGDPEPIPPASIRVLGLRWPATREAIGKAYRALAIQNHPDRGGRHEDMVRINQARDEALAYLAGVEARRAA